MQPVMRGEEHPVELERETERQRKEKRDRASEAVSDEFAPADDGVEFGGSQPPAPQGAPSPGYTSPPAAAARRRESEDVQNRWAPTAAPAKSGGYGLMGLLVVVLMLIVVALVVWQFVLLVK